MAGMGIHIALALLAAASTTAAQEPPRPPLHLWGTSTRVAVDGSGRVTAVETPGDYSQAIKDAVEAQVRKLRYEVPVVDGKPVPGETWVYLSACTAQEGETYRLALQFRGNGPSLAASSFPKYPQGAQRAGVGARYEVSIRIEPDGSASLERATALVSPKRYGWDFEQALKAWVKSMRYRVETVDGKPVGGQTSQKVDFFVDGPPIPNPSVAQMQKRANEKTAAEALARAQASETCALALKAREGEENRQVAIGSPIRVSEAN
jgi:hypothetical protein